jgi:D-alanine-D-alanine ligase
MIMKKKHIAVLCGGQSAEHEVSLESAKNVIQALDKEHYDVSAIFINRQGQWYLLDHVDSILNNPSMQLLQEPIAAQPLIFQIGTQHPIIAMYENKFVPLAIDAIFPVLHGTHGEDGTLQGFLEMANVPYVGAGVLSSSLCMDKEATKRLAQEAGVNAGKWLAVYRPDVPQLSFEQVVTELGLPFFVKPANTGSSVGISKVKSKAEFTPALTLALQYDDKILFEKFIPGREIECSVLGGLAEAHASRPGEIIPHHEFYSYVAKYIDPNGASLETPANLPADIIEKVQTAAKKVFRALYCHGMARVDFFVTTEGDVVFNEANTIPGFTRISQYPRMWEVSGLPYADLLTRLIELAIDRFEHHRTLVQGAKKVMAHV